MIFQDSTSSLNGRMKVADIIAEPMRIAHISPNMERTARSSVSDEIRELGRDLSRQIPPSSPGGQRQSRHRAGGALHGAGASGGTDEPVASLDVSIQAQIVNLFRHLQDEHGFRSSSSRMIFPWCAISATASGILLRGKHREAPSHELFRTRTPYTKALLSRHAASRPHPRAEPEACDV